MSYRGVTRLYGEPDEEYDLDNPDHLSKLGLDPNRQHADAYCHFKNCKWVVEERKSQGNLVTALKQLESTIFQLLANKRKVTDPVVIMIKMNHIEEVFFFVDPTTHQLRNKGLGTNVRIPNIEEPVKVYLRKDLDRIIAELREYEWA